MLVNSPPSIPPASGREGRLQRGRIVGVLGSYEKRIKSGLLRKAKALLAMTVMSLFIYQGTLGVTGIIADACIYRVNGY
jgi:hypothetical protein